MRIIVKLLGAGNLAEKRKGLLRKGRKCGSSDLADVHHCIVSAEEQVYSCLLWKVSAIDTRL